MNRITVAALAAPANSSAAPANAAAVIRFI